MNNVCSVTLAPATIYMIVNKTRHFNVITVVDETNGSSMSVISKKEVNPNDYFVVSLKSLPVLL